MICPVRAGRDEREYSEYSGSEPPGRIERETKAKTRSVPPLHLRKEGQPIHLLCFQHMQQQ